MSQNIVPGTAGGKHIGGAPLTLPRIEEAVPGLLQNSIDERIVKVRPMSTPIDQLSRCAGARSATAMTVEYYSVDTKLTESVLSTTMAAGNGRRMSDTLYTFRIETADDSIFEVSETILIPEVKGYAAEGEEAGPLMLYVVERAQNGGLTVAPVNGFPVAGGGISLPELKEGLRVVRMGRAASELDVQTAQFAALPRKASNNCQIFKMQVEQSTLAKIARKEVGWSFSDQEEAAIIDMRLGMEKNFLFGSRAVLFDPTRNEPVYFTGGIWQQTPREYTLNLDSLTEADLIGLCAAAFTGNSGSKRKILIAGTELLTALSRLQYSRSLSAGETFVKWGVEFREIRSNFGSLYVLHSEVFDQCGHAADGFVLDPDYMTKYVHVPFRAEKLDLRRSGVRNTDAVVLTEASCLVLRYPQSHIRVKGA
ncbi:MAG: DUF5309 family protein [Muribaculaceae bacterium]|nr:DUF5309 family protein [Muribaculaceae bacterium]